MCLDVSLLVLRQGGAADIDQSQQQSRAWLAWPALRRTVQRARHRWRLGHLVAGRASTPSVSRMTDSHPHEPNRGPDRDVRQQPPL
jgi:hypothetical protein